MSAAAAAPMTLPQQQPPPQRALHDYAPGIYRDVPEQIYHAPTLGVVSASAATALLRSPAHYRAWLAAPPRAARALDFGRAAHCALLEPERFARAYAVAPDFGDCRQRDNKQRRDEWRAAHADAMHISADDYAAITGIARSIDAHPIARNLLVDGCAELTLVWTCPDTALVCKARIDFWLADIGVAADLKTTDDASAQAFARSVRQYGYRRQAAHYLSGLAALGMPQCQFVFLAAEKEPPYSVQVFALDEEAIASGRRQMAAAKERLARCLDIDDWPAYGDDITTIGLERWETTNGE